jgi:flagellar biosynthesis protein FliR
VNAAPADLAYAGMLIFCRMGCCLMLLPGFGSARIEPRLRLLMAVAVTLALASLLMPKALAAASGANDSRKLALLAEEAISGAALGLLSRLYLLAVQFAANLATSAVGLAATPGLPIDDTELQPPLVSLIGMAAVTTIFAADLHYAMLTALIESYVLLPVGASLRTAWLSDAFLTRLAETWSLGLRLAAPFVIYSVIVNLAIGLANKLTPQISVYFITTGLVALGGILLTFAIIDDILGVFVGEFAAFIG